MSILIHGERPWQVVSGVYSTNGSSQRLLFVWEMGHGGIDERMLKSVGEIKGNRYGSVRREVVS